MLECPGRCWPSTSLAVAVLHKEMLMWHSFFNMLKVDDHSMVPLLLLYSDKLLGQVMWQGQDNGVFWRVLHQPSSIKNILALHKLHDAFALCMQPQAMRPFIWVIQWPRSKQTYLGVMYWILFGLGCKASWGPQLALVQIWDMGIQTTSSLSTKETRQAANDPPWVR